MEVLSRAMELLKDGKHHTLQELHDAMFPTGSRFATQEHNQEFKTRLVANFLVSHEFCDYISGVAVSPPSCPIQTLKLKADIITFLETLDKID